MTNPSDDQQAPDHNDLGGFTIPDMLVDQNTLYMLRPLLDMILNDRSRKGMFAVYSIIDNDPDLQDKFDIGQRLLSARLSIYEAWLFTFIEQSMANPDTTPLNDETQSMLVWMLLGLSLNGQDKDITEILTGWSDPENQVALNRKTGEVTVMKTGSAAGVKPITDLTSVSEQIPKSKRLN